MRETYRVVDGKPDTCANGHELKPPNIQVSVLRCDCQQTYGHTTYRCFTCHNISIEGPHEMGRELS